MILNIKDLNKAYINEGLTSVILKNVNLEISKPGLHVINGASGSGKSTLLRIIGLIDHFTTGKISISSTDISKMNEKEAAIFRNKNIGFVFQSFNLINFKSALENIMLPLLYAGKNIKESKERAVVLLNSVGLYKWANYYPNELSGGQKQRIAICRGIVNKPKLILADEPTGALDSKNGLIILELLQKLCNENQITSIIATHDKAVRSFANTIYLLEDGEIVRT